MSTRHAIADGPPAFAAPVRRILRDSPVVLPWAVLAAAVLLDGSAALGASLAGLLALVNLWVLAWAAGRLANPESGHSAAWLLAIGGVKLPLVGVATWWMVTRLGGEGVAIGVLAVLVGATVGAVRGNAGDVA